MTIQDIEQLARLMKETGLTSLSWERDGETLELGREVPPPPPAAGFPPFAQSVPPMTAEAPASPAEPETAGAVITSPMVGMLYLAPSPEAAPYVSVGSTVKKGDVLCIIEAMKLMNEITAEQDGVITEICAGNEQVVEFGQPLFRLK